MGKKVVIGAILIFGCHRCFIHLFENHGFSERRVVEKYTFNTNWLGKQNIYVYGTPRNSSRSLP